MIYKFRIEKQHIRCTNAISIASDSANVCTAVFTFDEEWDGFQKVVTFSNSDTQVNKYAILDDTNTCIIPWEVIEEPGRLNVYAEGVLQEKVITTYKIDRSLEILPSGKTDENMPQDPTPDVYQQILDRLNAIEAGEIDEEDIANAVNKYMEENPIDTLSEEDVQAICATYISEHPIDLSEYALKSEVPNVPDWAMNDSKPSYTAIEVGALPNTTTIPSKTSDLTNDSGYLSSIPEEYVTGDELTPYALKTEIPTVPTKVSDLQNDSGFITSVPDNYVTDEELGDYALKTDIPTIPTVPTKVSELTNDSGYISSIPSEYVTDSELEGYALKTDIPTVPTKTSELTNDSGFITEVPEVDLSSYALKTEIPTTLPASDVQAWAKAATKPTYTASEVGADVSGSAANALASANTYTDSKTADMFSGVYSDLEGLPTLNGKTIDGTLTTADFGIKDGEDGFSPTATVTKNGNETVISLTDKNGTTESTILDGKDGTGVYPQGEIIDGSSGTVTLVMQPNVRYLVNGAISALTLTLPAAYNMWDEFYILFVTSADGCTVSVPATLGYVEGSASSFDANKVYELDILATAIVCPPGTSIVAEASAASEEEVVADET